MHRRLNELMPMQVRPRSLEEVTGFFDGTDLVPSGVVRIAQWRPESELESRSPAAVWGGVGRKAE
ncbi:MAG TPA: SAM-dependent methyltransferase [Streptosporangiaceae bacterium]